MEQRHPRAGQESHGDAEPGLQDPHDFQEGPDYDPFEEQGEAAGGVGRQEDAPEAQVSAPSPVKGLPEKSARAEKGWALWGRASGGAFAAPSPEAKARAKKKRRRERAEAGSGAPSSAAGVPLASSAAGAFFSSSSSSSAAVSTAAGARLASSGGGLLVTSSSSAVVASAAGASSLARKASARASKLPAQDRPVHATMSPVASKVLPCSAPAFCPPLTAPMPRAPYPPRPCSPHPCPAATSASALDKAPAFPGKSSHCAAHPCARPRDTTLQRVSSPAPSL